MDARAVIVSGGTYGIGRAVTLELARRGWPVVAFGLEQRQPGSAAERGISGTSEALRREGLEADLLEADTAEPDDVRRVVTHARERHGGVRALVCNAAIRPTGTILDTPEPLFDRVLAVNLKGPYLLCREVIPLMRASGGGAIVLVGSGSARGRPSLLAYAASKGGLVALAHSLAEDHRGEGIRVNVVVPAPATESGMVEAMEARPEVTQPPEGVAAAVALLVSDASGPSGTTIDLGDGRREI